MSSCRSVSTGFFLAALLALLAAPAVAQVPVPGVTLHDTESRVLLSTKIGQRYELMISLPPDYNAAIAQRYPVLYVLDGWHFPLMAFLQDNNRFSRRMPPLIIVTIGYGRADASISRSRDFTPSEDSRVPGSGGALAFLEFFEQELIPFVDRTYRTDTNDRALLGHSFGGLFALFALERRPRLFQRIVAVSPPTSWDGRLLFAPDRLASFPAPVRLALAVGGEERFRDEVVAFGELLDKLKPRRLTYRVTVHPEENHDSVRLVSFPAALKWVYGDGP